MTSVEAVQTKEIQRTWLKSPRSSSSLQLCVLDQAMPSMYVPVVWVFAPTSSSPSSLPSVLALRGALESMIATEAYAPLSATIAAPAAPGGSTTLKWGGDSDGGVLWVESEAPDLHFEHFEWGQPQSIAFSNERTLFEVPTATTRTPPSSSPLPVLAIKLTWFANGTGLCVAASFHHQVFDGFGFALFMKHWEAFIRDPVAAASTLHQPLISRDLMSGFLCKKDLRESPPPTAGGMIGPELMGGSKIIVERFTAEELAKLKVRAVSDMTNGQWVSTKDALFAHIWRCFVATSPSRQQSNEGDYNSKGVRCSITFNTRKRLSEVGVCADTVDYFGNAVTVLPFVPSPTPHQLLSESLSCTALRVRQTLSEHSKSAEALQQALMSMTSAPGLIGGWRVGLDSTCNDWDGLGFYGLTLDGHKPDLVCASFSSPFPGLISLQTSPAPFDPKGLTAFIHVTAPQLTPIHSLLHTI